jgi:4'-phosphopantetheinyl transferase
MGLAKIRNHYLRDIHWLSASSYDFDITGHTDIWRINIGDNLSDLANFSALINTAETGRANRYLQLRDKNRFVISRAALRIILARYLNRHPEQIEFEIGVNKKPFLKNASLHYNVSHSGDWIAIAVSETNTGIDIEFVDPSFRYHDIISEYFSTEEAKYIVDDDAHSRFFLLWTRKEALTKATGKGLDDDLKLIPALDGEYSVEADLLKSVSNWYVNSFELSAGYLASIAITAETGPLRFWDIDLFHK